MNCDKLKEKIKSLHRYDIVGEYDHYMQQCDMGDYYEVDDIEELINQLEWDEINKDDGVVVT